MTYTFFTIYVHTVLANRRYCQESCSEKKSGGFLQTSVDELSSFQEERDLFVAVESSPPLFGVFSELEHHGQARASRTASFGATMTESNRRER